MKKIYTLTSILSLSLAASAQGIEIEIPGEGIDVSGTVVEIIGEEIDLHQDFDVNNVSGSTMTLRIERKKMVELDGTADYICWGADIETGACYPSGAVSPYDPWVTPDASDLNDGDSGWLSTHHIGNDIEGSAQYRYYIIDETDTKLDSVDVLFTFAVGIEEEQNLTVSLYPNPATSIVNIELNETVNNVNFNLYNVLGDRVMDRKLNAGNNSVNVSNLPNGVYFYSILKDGVIAETKKLVVRH